MKYKFFKSKEKDPTHDIQLILATFRSKLPIMVIFAQELLSQSLLSAKKI